MLRQALPLIVERIKLYRAGDPKDPDILLARETDSQLELWLTAWARLREQRPRPFPPGLRAVEEAASGIHDLSDLSNVEGRIERLLAGS